MGYYVGNAVYDYLKKSCFKENFFWTSADKWIMVYGSEASEPLLLTAVTQGEMELTLSGQEERLLKLVRKLASLAGLPVSFIRFRPAGPFDGAVYFEETADMRARGGKSPLRRITPSGLREHFQAFGLPVRSGGTGKQINDKASSPYHEWQRRNLGGDMTASDIDLLRFDGGRLGGILELERSKIPLTDWKPYEADRSNYILLSKLALRAGIRFHAVYNYRRERPFLDDVSRLKIFGIDFRRESFYRLLGYETVEEFADNRRSITCQ